MAEAFKNLIHAGTVREAAAHLQRAWPDFDAARFEALALHGLDALEFKARALHLCAALEATLPADFAQAAAVIEAALAPPGVGDDLSLLRSGPQGLAGWVVWPLGEFVVRHGDAQPQRALQTLHALTQRHTAEWALRPFIERHPAITFDTLGRIPAWAPIFASVSDMNLTILLVLTGIVSLGIAWHGWVSGARPGPPRAAVAA